MHGCVRSLELLLWVLLVPAEVNRIDRPPTVGDHVFERFEVIGGHATTLSPRMGYFPRVHFRHLSERCL